MYGVLDLSSTVNAGAVIVGALIAVCYLAIRYRLDKRSAAESLWQSEHAAQKVRADRLQEDKDRQQATINDQGAEIVRLKVRCAELEGRPNLQMLKDMLETSAVAQTALSQTLMEQITLHDHNAMEGLGVLSSDIRELVRALQERATKYRRNDDMAGDPPDLG